jgi:hypothetical protein
MHAGARQPQALAVPRHEPPAVRHGREPPGAAALVPRPHHRPQGLLPELCGYQLRIRTPRWMPLAHAAAECANSTLLTRRRASTANTSPWEITWTSKVCQTARVLPLQLTRTHTTAICERFDVRVEIYSELSPLPLETIRVSAAAGHRVRAVSGLNRVAVLPSDERPSTDASLLPRTKPLRFGDRGRAATTADR